MCTASGDVVLEGAISGGSGCAPSEGSGCPSLWGSGNRLGRSLLEAQMLGVIGAPEL